MTDNGILLKNIPATLIEGVIEELARFTVAFLQIEERSHNRDARLLGTGVLVKTGKTRAILTAHHVMEKLEGIQRLPLFLQKAREPHTIDAQGVQLLKIGRGKEEAAGPDLLQSSLRQLLPTRWKRRRFSTILTFVASDS